MPLSPHFLPNSITEEYLGWEGTLVITQLVPKVYNNVFLFVGLTTLVTIEFELFGSLSGVSKRFNH